MATKPKKAKASKSTPVVKSIKKKNKARPARNVVKILPLKAAKEMTRG